MNTITRIHAERILDSRGKPTLRVSVETSGGRGSFDVPSGASTGSREARELRDADGGVASAVHAVEDLSTALSGSRITDQAVFDARLRELDGTRDKSRLGGNALIGASIAFARAQAASEKHELYYHLRSLATMSPSRETPRLFVNLVNGGKHAEGGSPIQEHQIVTETDDIAEALAQAEAVEAAIASIMTERGILQKHGDEGGVVFPVASVDEPFALLTEAIARAGISGLSIGADAAASSFYADGSYDILGVAHTKDALSTLYASLHEKHGLAFLEDPFEENDGAAFAALKRTVPGFTLIGDDLTTTDPAAIRTAAEQGAIQAVIVKPNQIGTLSETIEAMKAAREHGVHCIVSHRSGDTMDPFIADLAFAFGAYGLKAGAPRAPERRVKYERLIEISHGATHRSL